jgi:hypothetical protein
MIRDSREQIRARLTATARFSAVSATSRGVRLEAMKVYCKISYSVVGMMFNLISYHYFFGRRDAIEE